MEKKDKIDEIRSTEVQEILGHIPPWTIRWGISVVFGMILILLGISWVVKYPDYIEGQINVKPKNPPIKLLAKNTGLLSALHYQNGDRVSKGSLIAVIENPISNEAISWIDSTISKVEKSLSDKGNLEELNLQLENDLTLGGIQNDFNRLREQINAWKTIEYNDFHRKKIKHLKKQIEYYSRLVTISFRKMEYGKQEFQNAEKQYQIQKELLDKKVISQAEFIQAENLFLQQKHALESHKQSYVQNNITRTEYKKQLDELTFNQEENKRKTTESIHQSIQNIKNELANWQHSYAI